MDEGSDAVQGNSLVSDLRDSLFVILVGFAQLQVRLCTIYGMFISITWFFSQGRQRVLQGRGVSRSIGFEGTERIWEGSGKNHREQPTHVLSQLEITVSKGEAIWAETLPQ